MVCYSDISNISREKNYSMKLNSTKFAEHKEMPNMCKALGRWVRTQPYFQDEQTHGIQSLAKSTEQYILVLSDKVRVVLWLPDKLNNLAFEEQPQDWS